eukprot:TRINITY_DN15383_c0_g1_i1.p1 TRINITY_DN15383_c0_g1~~TRINITY_DN15383_c0_g1_i1.p1  ORF type:complete len:209 (-),score=26.92 TRINITY_DN15383_c0_g1_i1:191-817(-)
MGLNSSKKVADEKINITGKSRELTEEEMEEIKMFCSFNGKQIMKLFDKFENLRIGENSHSNEISVETFLSLPQLASNPFKIRLPWLFDVNNDGSVSFREFVHVLSTLSPNGSLEKKLRFAFKLYDSDRDGKISESDLIETLEMISSFPEKTTVLEGEPTNHEILSSIAGRVIDEASSDPKTRVLRFADFSRVMMLTDFHTKMNIPIDV